VDHPDEVPSVSFRDAVRVWCRVALLSFGGPAGQIAVMHRILVEEKRWISESRFLHALNYCMLLPGPEAQQLATYIGWLLHRTTGGLVAGVLFVFPGFVSILALSVLYAGYHDLELVQALFFGLKPAVVAVVIDAVIRIGRRSIRNRITAVVAVTAFGAIFFYQVPFPLIVLAAGLTGLAGGRIWPEHFSASRGPTAEKDLSVANQPVLQTPAAAGRPTALQTFRIAVTWLTIWLAPIGLLWALAGRQSVFTTEALFFSQAAVVTFGGAYSVLAYIAQECVSTYGWLRPGEMLDGLGMAETTPGPLIQVVQFVGFMGAYRNPGGLDPMLAGVLGSLITTWVTFAPCFLWIFLGAPFIELLRGQRSLNAALSTITAAVVGVILNLSLWFSIHTLFARADEHYIGGLRLLIPDWPTIDVASAAITAGAMVAMFRFKCGMVTTLAISAGLGIVYHLLVAR